MTIKTLIVLIIWVSYVYKGDIIVAIASAHTNNVFSKVSGSNNTNTVCFKEQSSPPLSMFTEELPILPTVFVSTGAIVSLGAYRITQRLHAELPLTTFYAFGLSSSSAQYPGPILEARRWVPAKIRWENHVMDREHMLPVDESFGRAEPRQGGVPIVVHLHGAEVDGRSDGNPDAWFTARGDMGPQYTTSVYEYQNQQPPCMLWYHDHTVGITRLNIASGLFGPYIIRSPSEEDPLGLPKGPYEIVLVFQDKRFFNDGRIRFPNVGSNPAVHPLWCPDSFGDTMVVNGKIWPFLRVYSLPYRFRMLNANTERFLNMSFVHSRRGHLPFMQIGTDGGYLTRPRFNYYLLIAPAERIDIIIDFSDIEPGSEIILTNSARAPFPNGNNGPGKTGNVMKFIITSWNEENRTSFHSNKNMNAELVLPQYGSNFQWYHFTKTRVHRIIDVFSPGSTIPVQLLLNYLRWTDPVTEIVQTGSTELWELINLTNEAHPIHIHLVNFLVVNIQTFNLVEYTNSTCSLDVPYPGEKTCFTGYSLQGLDMPSYLQGWKDTVIAMPGFITRLAIHFGGRDGHPFPFDPTTPPGYLWHCHLLGHEDNDMMRPLYVIY